MPSKCLVQKFEEIIEDVKIINEFYCENGAEGILEMIQLIKYLIAIISDILNHQTESKTITTSQAFIADSGKFKKLMEISMIIGIILIKD